MKLPNRSPWNVWAWAFSGAVLGFTMAWARLEAPWVDDGFRVNLIELISQSGGWAVIAAVIAYVRNRIGNRTR